MEPRKSIGQCSPEECRKSPQKPTKMNPKDTDSPCNCRTWYLVPECPKDDEPEKPNTTDITDCKTKGLIDTSKTPIVWVLGGPGSGKGVQCQKIVAKYGLTHLSVGDLLRAEVQFGSERSKVVTTIMGEGGLVPNEIVLDLLKENILAKADKSCGFLVDGYPREKCQGIAFEEAIAPPTVILYFEASILTLARRLMDRAASSGRDDDNESTINLRLQTFYENNRKLLEQYPSKIHKINAECSEDEIFAEVQKVLDPIVADCKMKDKLLCTPCRT